jgi:hypothetical protein
MVSSLCSRLSKLLYRFRRERKGNVAITFALASIPIMGFVGAAIDYSHANAVRVALQSALDSAALMLAKDSANLSGTGLDDKAVLYVNALFNRTDATITKIKATYTPNGGTSVKLDGSADVPTDFIGILGQFFGHHAFDAITVSSSSTAKNGGPQTCGWRWCSTIPARWRSTARSARSRTPPKAC